MKHIRKSEQSGGAVFNILLIILLLAIAVLTYLLLGGTVPESVRSIAVQSPVVVNEPQPDSQPVPGPAPVAAANEPQSEFSDGLAIPVTTEKFSLNEFGEGISQRDVYSIDINNDGRRDRITRTHHAIGTGHDYDEYRIELNIKGKYKTITPDDMRTVAGADCALTRFKFEFKPDFRVIKISRPWVDSWDTPSVATKTIYVLNGKKMHEISSEELGTMCDVSGAF